MVEAPGIKFEQSFRVALVSKAATDLARTRERTNLTGTDILNRAVSLYDFIDQELHSGTELLLRRQDGSTHLLELF
jgi:hypothetical protein